MRHYKKGRKLGTDWSHTHAMKRSLVCSLFLNDRIKTIESRAKEIRPDVDKVITWAKKGDLHSRRLAIAFLNDKDLVAEIFEKVSQGMFADRQGGYTRIMKLGYRKGDNAPMVIMELVTEPVAKKAATKKKAAPKKVTPKKVEETKSEEVAEDLGFEEDGTVEQLEAVDAAETVEETGEEKVEAIEEAKAEEKEAFEEAVEAPEGEKAEAVEEGKEEAEKAEAEAAKEEETVDAEKVEDEKADVKDEA